MPSSLTGIFGKLYEMRTARQRAIVTTVDSFLILSSSSPTPSIWVITSCVEANLKLGDENFLNLKTFKVHYKCLSYGIRFELENSSNSNVMGTIKYLKCQ